MESKIPDWMGNLPFEPDKKVPVKIDSNDMGETAIYGEGTQRICCYTYISTDNILISHWIVPPGQSFQPPDIHSGDEPYYVLKGEAHVFNPETDPVTIYVDEAAIIIPAGSFEMHENDKYVYKNDDEGIFLCLNFVNNTWSFVLTKTAIWDDINFTDGLDIYLMIGPYESGRQILDGTRTTNLTYNK